MTVVPGFVDLRRDAGYQTAALVETLRRVTAEVERRKLAQWFFRITDYAQPHEVHVSEDARRSVAVPDQQVQPRPPDGDRGPR